jgi:hypothetical protein
MFHWRDNAITARGALAQETRLAPFRLLLTCGPAELRAGVMPNGCGFRLRCSLHLALLVHDGLITQRRASR